MQNADFLRELVRSESAILTREKGRLLTSQKLAYTARVDLLPSADPSAALPEVSRDSFDSDPLAQLLVQAEASFRLARAPATLRAYEHDWREFRLWCERNHLLPLPASPQAVILYSTDLTKNQHRRWNTLSRRLAAISQLHQQAGFESPTRSWAVEQFLAGLRRELGIAPVRKKPVRVEDLKLILERIPDSLLGLRDRALLLLGFSGAFRRSELVSLDVQDLEETREGLVVTLRRSKTDPEGEGRKVGVPQGAEQASCPLWAIEQWRAAARIECGPLFRSVDPPRARARAAAVRRSRFHRGQALRRATRLRSVSVCRTQSARVSPPRPPPRANPNAPS